MKRLLAGLTLIGCTAAGAQEALRIPLPDSHPLVGTWRLELPPSRCVEEYEIRPDGTKRSSSAEERNESEFAITLLPSPGGFYRWVDRITANNGQPDCAGATTAVGHVAVNFVRLHPSGERMLLCRAEEMKSCFAELQRKP